MILDGCTMECNIFDDIYICDHDIKILIDIKIAHKVFIYHQVLVVFAVIMVYIYNSCCTSIPVAVNKIKLILFDESLSTIGLNSGNNMDLANFLNVEVVYSAYLKIVSWIKHLF